MMRLLLILSSVLIVQAAVVKESCDGVLIDNQYHDLELLKEGLDRPFLLATDYSRNTVYFSYSLNDKDDNFKSAYIDLNTKEFGNIEVENGFAQAVDQKTHDVYIGGSGGVYKYDRKSKKAQCVSGENFDIWSIYYKDVVYFTDYPNQTLYSIKEDQLSIVEDFEDTNIHLFVIDNDDVFFYTNETGLYSHKKGTKDTILYEKKPEVRGITIDRNNEVYVCRIDGIYRVERDIGALKKVVELEEGFGVAFDNENNIVYVDINSVYRLKLNKKKNRTCKY